MPVSGTLRVPEQQELEEYIALVEQMEHGKYVFTRPLSPQGIKDSCLWVKYNYLGDDPVVKDRMARLKKGREFLLFDTLIPSPSLREILMAANLAKDILRDRTGLPSEVGDLLEEKVTDEVIRRPVLELNQYYREVTEKTIKYPGSLIHTEHLEMLEDVDSLWQALLAPYRGKVIYLDFWGTWCAPCKKMMKLVRPIERFYQDKEVIFMYFAYASPEESWNNVIREYEVSGKNIVHYNLSSSGQQKILKMWKVDHFPTFMLIDREGKVVNRQAPAPDQEKN